MNDQDIIAKTAIGALLDGAAPNGVDPAGLGPWGTVYEEMVRAYQGGGTDAARRVFEVYARNDPGLAALRAGDIQEPAAFAWNGEEAPDTLAPPLPEEARLPEELAAGAAPWLDAYIAFSRKWSPRGYDGYHEAVGLWVLSTVAARRLVLHFGGPRYPGLYIALVGRTSIFAKTTTAKIGLTTLREAGLKHLLAPDDSTPQAFLRGMAGRHRVPEGWELLPEEQQQRLLKRLEFPAQRGWFYDELGQKISAMMRDGGHMADFRGLLRRLDDAPETYEYESIGRGTDYVERPYLALLGNVTPADLAPYAEQGGPLWGDGFWARWAFVTPDPNDPPNLEGRFPDGELHAPGDIIGPLQRLHQHLGVPRVAVVPQRDGDGKVTGYQVERTDPEPTRLRLGDGVADAFYNYHDALTTLAHESDNQDLDGNYARFAEKALRVAMLLAALQDGTITLAHWARAQQVAERWRAGLHNLYAQVNRNAGAEQERRLERKILELLQERGAMTARDIARFAHVKTAVVKELLPTLVEAGLVNAHQGGRTTHFSLADGAD